MRLAVTIICLILFVIISFQACTVGVGSGILGDEETQEGASVGILVGFTFMLGGAFAYKLPKVAMVFLLIGGLLGLAVGGTTDFSDMSIWGGVAIILAIMSYIGSRGLKKEKEGK